MDDTDDLLDYCAGCVQECGWNRLDTLTNPHMIYWDGGGHIAAYYECDRGHVWRCWWDARRCSTLTLHDRARRSTCGQSTDRSC